MEIVKWILIFTVSLFVLLKASDIFIDCAEKLGKLIGMPPFVIGVLIIGFGTSLPELISSIFAVINNSSEIVIGNVLGSNITNIFLVLGTASLLKKKFVINFDIMKADIPFLIGSAALLSFMISDFKFTTMEAVILLVTLGIYIFYCLTDRPEKTIYKDKAEKENKESKKDKKKLHPLVIVGLIVSPVFIFFGAKFTIDAVINFSMIMKIDKDIIALSAVALGTSLPEVIVAVKAAKKGNPELAVGNVIGSNIFNTLAVMGIPALIGPPLAIPPNIMTFIVPIFLTATGLYIIIAMDKKVYRIEGYLLIIFYLYFLGTVLGIL